jgi:hypothetical protein
VQAAPFDLRSSLENCSRSGLRPTPTPDAAAGMDDVLKKPFHAHELDDILERWLRDRLVRESAPAATPAASS